MARHRIFVFLILETLLEPIFAVHFCVKHLV